MTTKKSTMVRKSHQGGIGAVGSAFANFFHLSQQIRSKFPNDYKTRCLDNVTIIQDGTEVVRHLRQHYYFCNSIATVIFEAKRHATDLPGAITQSNAEDENCCSLNNMEQNVSSRRTASKDIAELHCQGILVNDDNEPAPENVWSPPPEQSSIGE